MPKQAVAAVLVGGAAVPHCVFGSVRPPNFAYCLSVRSSRFSSNLGLLAKLSYFYGTRRLFYSRTEIPSLGLRELSVRHSRSQLLFEWSVSFRKGVRRLPPADKSLERTRAR